jgi:hexosaminidase
MRDATSKAINPVVQPPGDSSPSSVITLSLESGSDALVGESYQLQISRSGVKLIAGTYAGMIAATATLVQALELEGDYDAVPTTPENCTTAPVWRVPVMEIADGPALPYRGIMVDAARAYLPLTALKSYVMLCRVYKLNYMHIHMTDDGAFPFPSTAYPKLAASSKWSYTLADLHELQRFAAARGVAIIPEMDVPGHSGALVKTLPGDFGFQSKPGGGIIDFTNDTVIAAVQTLFDEMLAVFPSEYVHTQ